MYYYMTDDEGVRCRDRMDTSLLEATFLTSLLSGSLCRKALKVFLSCFKQNAEKVRLIDYI
jgi:hypothetical protein